MKKNIFLSFLFFHFFYSSAQELNVMTFNIRLNIASDSLNAWPFRKDKVASQIIFHKIDLLGVQEALHDQVMDLQARLPKFKYVGGGRDDGKEKGEYSAIFYDTTKLQLLQAKMFWLTEKAYTIKLAVSDLNATNELTMVAENLGSIPPNTSYMIVMVGEDRYDARLESTEGSSAMVRFVKKQ